jgi:hypothetical protein
MKQIHLFVWFIIFSLHLNAQTDCVFLPVSSGGKWGFIDCRGKLKVPLIYDRAGEYRSGFCTVIMDNNTGVIDTAGQMILHPVFESVNILRTGYFIVKNKDFAIADNKGNLLIDFKYKNIRQLDSNTFVLQENNDLYRLFHSKHKKTGEELWDKTELVPGSSYIQVWKNRKAGVADPDHNMIISPGDYDQYKSENGFLVAESSTGFSFFNLTGKNVSQNRNWKNYRFAGFDYVIVSDKVNDLSFLNLRTGKYILEHKFHKFYVLNYDFIVTVKSGKHGLADSEGKLLTGNIFDTLKVLNSDFILCKAGGKYGLVDRHGKTILPAECDFIDDFNKTGNAVYAVNGRLGLLQQNGKIFCKPQYNDIEIDSLSLKCYNGSDLDVYNFTTTGKPDEKLSFRNVHRLTVSGRYIPSDNAIFSNTDFNDQGGISSGAGTAVIIPGASKYDLVRKPFRYPHGSKMKTLIPGNLEDVNFLIGARVKENKKPLISPDYWDIQLTELEQYDLARIILPGGRHALISAGGKLITNYPVKTGTRTSGMPITYIGPFSSGLARICLGGTYVRGEDIADPRPVMKRHSLTVKGGFWGFINARGDMVLSPEFEYASDFRNGKAIISRQGKYGVIDSTGNFLIKPEYSLISWLPDAGDRFFCLIQYDTLNGLIDVKGKLLLEPVWDKTGESGDGLVAVMKNGKWGYTDLSGKVVIEPLFQAAKGFSEGLAAVKMDYKWGFINMTGQFIIDPVYRNAGSFRNGLAPVAGRGGWTYTDKTGNIVFSGRFRRAEEFEDGLAEVKVRRRRKLIDVNGKSVHRGGFTKISRSGVKGLFIVKKGKKVQLMNASGKLTGRKFARIEPFSEGLAVVSKNRRYGFTDTTGRLVVPLKYRGAGPFSCGLAKVVFNGKYGFINSKDSLQIPFIFRICESFSEGYVVGVIKRHTCVSDRNGNILFELENERKAGKYSEGYLRLGYNLYNTNGEKRDVPGTLETFLNGTTIIRDSVKIPGAGIRTGRACLADRNFICLGEYSSIRRRADGYFISEINMKYGIADSSGKVVVPCEYHSISRMENGFFRVIKSTVPAYLNSTGEWIWKPE